MLVSSIYPSLFQGHCEPASPLISMCLDKCVVTKWNATPEFLFFSFKYLNPTKEKAHGCRHWRLLVWSFLHPNTDQAIERKFLSFQHFLFDCFFRVGVFALGLLLPYYYLISCMNHENRQHGDRGGGIQVKNTGRRQCWLSSRVEVALVCSTVKTKGRSQGKMERETIYWYRTELGEIEKTKTKQISVE